MTKKTKKIFWFWQCYTVLHIQNIQFQIYFFENWLTRQIKLESRWNNDKNRRFFCFSSIDTGIIEIWTRQTTAILQLNVFVFGWLAFVRNKRGTHKLNIQNKRKKKKKKFLFLEGRVGENEMCKRPANTRINV